ncbi:MAG: hypothetical protein WC214_06235, partial [Candidatus Omnitrophota bacterium]
RLSLTALAGTAVYGLLSSGVKVWGAYNEIKNYGDVSIFFEKIGIDIENINLECGDVFYGNKSGFSAVFNNNFDFLQQPLVKIKYIYIPEKRKIVREVYYIKESEPVYASTILEEVETFEIKYFSLDDGSDDINSSDSLEQSLPNYIYVNIVISNEQFGRILKVMDL